MSSWRSSNVDEMVLASFIKKGPLLPKEEVHWRVLRVVGFVVIREAFVGMEPYKNLFWQIFSEQALSVGKLPRTKPMGGFALATTQVAQFIKFDEMSETSTIHGGLTPKGSIPIQELPRLEVPSSRLRLITMA